MSALRGRKSEEGGGRTLNTSQAALALLSQRKHNNLKTAGEGISCFPSSHLPVRGLFCSGRSRCLSSCCFYAALIVLLPLFCPFLGISGLLCSFPFVGSAAANIFSFLATKSHPFLASVLSRRIIPDSVHWIITALLQECHSSNPPLDPLTEWHLYLEMCCIYPFPQKVRPTPKK